MPHCTITPPPPPSSASMALYKHGVGVEPPFLGFIATFFFGPECKIGRKVVVRTNSGSVMAVIVHFVHVSILPHIATQGCLF